MASPTRIIGSTRRCRDHHRRDRRGHDPGRAADRPRRSSPIATAFSLGSAARLAEWERLLGAHRAAPLIAYHNTWPYFARRFRLDIVDVIELKEGVAPSPARLAKLASIIREQRVRVILHEPFEPDDASQLLARRTGATVLKLAPSVGSLPQTADYLALFDYNVGQLARALSAASN